MKDEHRARCPNLQQTSSATITSQNTTHQALSFLLNKRICVFIRTYLTPWFSFLCGFSTLSSKESALRVSQLCYINRTAGGRVPHWGFYTDCVKDAQKQRAAGQHVWFITAFIFPATAPQINLFAVCSHTSAQTSLIMKIHNQRERLLSLIKTCSSRSSGWVSSEASSALFMCEPIRHTLHCKTIQFVINMLLDISCSNAWTLHTGTSLFDLVL